MLQKMGNEDMKASDNNLTEWSILLILIFSFLSFCPCLIPSVADKFQNSFDGSAIYGADYQSWLLVSIVASIPSMIIRFLDVVKPLPFDQSILILKRELPRSLKVISIIIPDTILYLWIRFCTTSAIFAQVQNSIFYMQSLVIIGTILCSTFHHKYNGMITSKRLAISVESWTVVFLLIATAFKFFQVLSFLFSPISFEKRILSLVATALLFIAIFLLIFIIYNLTYYLTPEMKKNTYSFTGFDQKHDFLRMLGIISFASYVIVLFYSSNQALDFNNPFGLNESAIVKFLIGKVLLIIYLTIVDERCLLFQVELELVARLDLIRYLSHEIRSPLNTSTLGVQLLQAQIEDILTAHKNGALQLNPLTLDSRFQQALAKQQCDLEEVLEMGEMVRDSLSAALGTLNDLLTFDKLDDNKMHMELEEVDLLPLVEDTTKAFRINAMKEQVALSVKHMGFDSQEELIVKADAIKISQVLRNFLSNALKFTPKETGEVKVLVEVREHSLVNSKVRSVVRVSVQDNGCGISAENRARMFGKYVQIRASALQKGQGSGLGLWISKRLVELHGGAIGVESGGEGQGSTFFFELPLIGRRELPSHATSSEEEFDQVSPEEVMVDASYGVFPATEGFSSPRTSAGRMSKSLKLVTSLQESPVGVACRSYELGVVTASNSTIDPSICNSPEARNMSSLMSVVPPLGLRVLVVDDSASNRKVLNKLLSRLGYKVEEAVDGLEFLELVGVIPAASSSTSNVSDKLVTTESMSPNGSVSTAADKLMQFEFVMIDDNMPRMCGPEAVSIARAAGYRGLIFGLTGNTSSEQLEDFKQKGTDFVFTKPLDVAKLSKMLEMNAFVRSL